MSTRVRAPRALYALGALLVVYLGYPVGAFLVRAIGDSDAGWHDAGLFAALRVSLEGATISLGIGVLGGIPLAYLLARRRGPLAALVNVVVQLPLAVPPLISGILLVEVIGPYTWLGQRSGERLTQTMIGVIIAMSFVSTPFLVVAARSAFRSVDPSLSEVAATLGHGRTSRFLRVEVPAAGEGIRAGMILMWLRAFGEYGTVVVLAYHPYTLPVYVENLFSSAPLSQAEAPTLLAFGVAALAILIGYGSLGRLAGWTSPRRRGGLGGRGGPRGLSRVGALGAPQGPGPGTRTPVAFALETRIGGFQLRAAHHGGAHRLALVGASGAGKSMALRGLAGLLGPDVGCVRFGEHEVSALAPERRGLGYVPQGYGLMPGASVARQVLFGVGADPARAAWWLETLGIAELADRRPDELSGGQRQRVSLARALATDPSVVLLDEPFSALDTPVRLQLRRELRRLQRDVGLSTVLVTHDPEEAAMLADEIIVLGDGQVLQAGPCPEVFARPASLHVGRLLGMVNLFTGPAPAGTRPSVLADAGRPARSPVGEAQAPGAALWHVPPECVRVCAAAEGGEPGIDLGAGRVDDVIDLGARVEIVVALARGEEIRARVLDRPKIDVGDACRVLVDPGRLSAWSVAGS